MQLETSNWSGEGAFTQVLIESITRLDGVAFLRVEDAPATRAETGYSFISNELYVRFHTRERVERVRRFGFWPGSRSTVEKVMTLENLAQALSSESDIGPADYGDDGMIQYLRTERIVPPYQTRGYKSVELARIYEVDASRPRSA